jgi:hypothetical protein
MFTACVAPIRSAEGVSLVLLLLRLRLLLLRLTAARSVDVEQHAVDARHCVREDVAAVQRQVAPGHQLLRTQSGGA